MRNINELRSMLCGYREGHSADHVLIKVVEKWKKSQDNSGIARTILMELSKANDYLPNGLLIKKLAANGFNISSLCLVYNCLTNRHQRVKIAFTKCYRQELLVGVLQGSVLGPLLFKIFSNDLILFNMSSVLLLLITPFTLVEVIVMKLLWF